MSNLIEWPGTATLSEEPAPEPRDPIETPWHGDVWTDGRYWRTYVEPQLKGPGDGYWRGYWNAGDVPTHIQYWTRNPDETHTVPVIGGGTREIPRRQGRGRMTIPRWRAWCAAAELVEPGSDPDARPPLPKAAQRYGAIGYTGGMVPTATGGQRWSERATITYQMEWGSVRMEAAAPWERTKITITIHGRDVVIPNGPRDLGFAWAFYQGVKMGLAEDDADRAAWLAAFEGGAGNVIDLPTVDQ